MDRSAQLSSKRTVDSLRLLGGALALDFANIVNWRLTTQPEELIDRYANLVWWGQYVGVLSEPVVASLLESATYRLAEAKTVIRGACDLREAIVRVFSAVAHGECPSNADLEILRSAYFEALRHARLQPLAHGFELVWEENTSLDRMLWPVARSAFELLTGGELDRIKQCPGPNDCGWLFVDRSKNNSRRWCSMEGCGSRVKMRRQYARRKERSV